MTDAVNSSNYTFDIDQQTATENYVYDAIGNLIEDKAEGITAIDWTVYGKISSIAKSGGTIRYVYDAAGNRVAKMYNGDTTVYVRDASGNVMSVYERKQTGAVEQLEVHLYGSSRLGMVTRRTAADSLDIPLDGGYGNAKELTFTRAEKIFELSNHLGNVLVTISDRRLAVDDGNGDIAYYEADVVTANDYYPFGMLMPGRSYSATGAYRYGFNGKENDNEVKGEGGQQDYGMRIYDPRLGRFLSVDPITKDYPWYTPYQFAGNMPIWAIDLDGNEPKVVINKALEYLGTLYEWGGKNPTGNLKGGLSSQYGFAYAELEAMDWLREQELRKISLSFKGVNSAKKKMDLYSHWNDYLLSDNIVKYGSNSFGIDCSGLSRLAFNADKERLMGSLGITRAKDQFQTFKTAIAEGKGVLHSKFNYIGEGDLVFNSSKFDKVSHVMIATGQVRLDDEGNVTEFQVVHAPASGKFVEMDWMDVKKNYSIGHTFRKGDTEPAFLHIFSNEDMLEKLLQVQENLDAFKSNYQYVENQPRPN